MVTDVKSADNEENIFVLSETNLNSSTATIESLVPNILVILNTEINAN